MGGFWTSEVQNKKFLFEFLPENILPGVVFYAEYENHIHFLSNPSCMAPGVSKFSMVEKKINPFFCKNRFFGTVFDADFENDIHHL